MPEDFYPPTVRSDDCALGDPRRPAVGDCDAWITLSGLDVVHVQPPGTPGGKFAARLVELEDTPTSYELRFRATDAPDAPTVALRFGAAFWAWLQDAMEPLLDRAEEEGEEIDREIEGYLSGETPEPDA